MAIFAIILLIFAVLLAVTMYVISKTNDSDDIMIATGVGAVIMLFIITGILILKDIYNPPITPMDVYQNKTTLQITYKDSVIVDSVVVWK
jgi:hypothetical protein